jgi:hypothetical protein
MLTRYLKAVLALLPLVALCINKLVEAIAESGADGSLDGSEILWAVVGLITPIAVYLGKNTTTDPNVAANESVALRGSALPRR